MRLLDYIRGFREGNEAHRLEKEAMRDPFLADAMDGYDSAGGNQERRIEELRRLVKAKSVRKKDYIAVWSMAASVLIGVFISGYFLFQQKSPIEQEQEIAYEMIEPSAPISEENSEEALSDNTSKTSASPLIAGNLEHKAQDPATPSAALRVPDAEETQISEDIQMSQDILASEDSNQYQIAHVEPAVTGEIHGKVTDQNGDPLIGASVTLKGTDKGVITDVDGIFALRAEGKETLIVEYVGYDSVVLPTDTTSNMLIAMNENTRFLDEIVVTSYATRKEPKTIASIQTEEFAEKPKPVMGMKAFKKYLKENQVRPEGPDCAGVKGKVILSFHVNKEGRPEKITVKRGLCTQCDNEAIRLIKEGPDWTLGNEAVEITIRF